MPISAPPKHAAPRRSLSRRLTVAAMILLVGAGTTVGLVVARHGSARPVRAGGTVGGPSAARDQPNIVLILTDDQRWDELRQMPTVEHQIVGKGVTFVNAFVVNPLCCPSRTTILTGKYSHSTDVYRNWPPHGGFPTFQHEEGSTIATWLHDAGYRTALVGKYLNGYTPDDVAHIPAGWDDWKAQMFNGAGDRGSGYYGYSLSDNGTLVHYGTDPSDYSTAVFAKFATDFVRSTPSSQPLFLYFATRAPHIPATPPARYSRACPDLSPLRPPSYNEVDVSDKPHFIRIIPPMPSELQAVEDRLHRMQCQSLLGVDDAVSEILTALKNDGRLSNTLILFASDNGLQFGEHRLISKKVPYEESIRVPVVIRYDPITHLSARTDHHLVLNLDFAQTFAAAAGVSAPGAEGRSLLPLLSGTPTAWRKEFLIEHWAPRFARDWFPPYCAVRTAHDIYVEYVKGEEELYNLRADPYELRNLAADPAQAALKSRLHAEMVRLCSPPPPGFTP